MKKLIAIVLAMMLLVSMTACGAAQGENAGNADGKFTIGICQFMPHPALDKATEGFIAAVEAGLGKENVTFDTQNAAGEASNCSTIVNGLVEPCVLDAEVGTTYQFLRVGYFCKDPVSTAEKPVFNRTVGLRDSFTKQVKK